MRSVVDDLRYAGRLLLRRPGYALAAILTLALGIGANTAIFAVVRGVLLRPLPYAAPDRVVMVWSERKGDAVLRRGIATPDEVQQWRARNTSFTDLAVIELWSTDPAARMDLAGAEGAERLRGSFASPNFFDVLGVKAALGRTFSDSDAASGAADVVVLSDGLWRRRFGADRGIIGRTIELTLGRPRGPTRFTVIGVMASRFQFTYPEDTELWTPRSWHDVDAAPKGAVAYTTIARLREGVSMSRAQAEMTAVNEAIARDVPDGRYLSSLSIRLEPVQDYAVGQFRSAMLLLISVTAFLFVIACVNVANLLLARTVERSRELAVRAALGAGRARLVRQLLAEGIVLATAGGIVGIAFAAMLQPALRATLPSTIPRIDEIGIDAITLAWAVGIAALTSIAAGLAPSWRGTPNLHAALKQGGSTVTGDVRASRWRRVLIVAQVAAVVVLLSGGGLLVHSFWNLQRVDLGFDGSRVLTMEMRLAGPRYANEERLRLFQQALLERMRAVPGVTQASMTSSVPLRGTDWMWVVRALGVRQSHFMNEREVDPEYFGVMRIALRDGRLFDRSDTEASPLVAILSESAARLIFPGENAVGKIVDPPGPFRIVGVVADVRHARVDQAPKPAIYTARAQRPSELICLVARTIPGATGVPAASRGAINSIDPSQPVEGITTLDQIVSESIADRRFYAAATTAFSIVALLLAVAGLYGVVSRGVTERMRELGIRIVLGAARRDLIGLVVRQGLSPVVVGLAAGTVAAFWTSRLLRGFLFDVRAVDPVTYVAVPALVVVVATVACYIPARRATRLDPIAALRE
jgi:putative ABC transport system permease protein